MGLQFGDGVEPRVDFLAVDLRPQHPGAEQARAHAGDGLVDGAEQGGGAPGGARGFVGIERGETSSRLRTVTGSSTERILLLVIADGVEMSEGRDRTPSVLPRSWRQA